MLIPHVIGFRLFGTLQPSATATDLVLRVTEILRKKGVVGKFVEYFGPGMKALSLADRATLANMSPEYGATMGYFPVDEETLSYLRFTGRNDTSLELIEKYYRGQGLFYDGGDDTRVYSDTIELDLGTVVPSIAGPKRPQDRVELTTVKEGFRSALKGILGPGEESADKRVEVRKNGDRYDIGHGSVVIAAITSCTNTSNPSVMIAAGLLARKAAEKGLVSKPWVKTSLAPGSKVVTAYLEAADLLRPLEKLGFHVVGYGCTTCIGNSGPLPEEIATAVQENGIVAVSVLSGNRNFEGRINQHVRANYLASPPLVVAYAIAGTMDTDIMNDPLGNGSDGKPVYLRDVWPTPAEVSASLKSSLRPAMFTDVYAGVFEGDKAWKSIAVPQGELFEWDPDSTYIKAAPYFDGMNEKPEPLGNITGLHTLVMLGDSVTTDHISPAGSIAQRSPAGTYLTEKGVSPKHFNSYGSRRGNHEVMMRGTFANIRLRNLMVPGTEGGMTRHPDSEEPVNIFDAAMKYHKTSTPLMVIAGREYGSGSSRDWAAKGPKLLGVRVVLAESYERIHRSNLIGMGILPLQFEPGQDRKILGLTGFESFDVEGISDEITPGSRLKVVARTAGSKDRSFRVLCRLDTPMEVEYYRHDGILRFVLRALLKK
jgi:aconitate hydratase